MLVGWSITSGPPRFKGRAWALGLLALIAGCSVYTDSLVLPGTAGGGGKAGTAGEGQMQIEGGGPANQGGIDNQGATGAAPLGGSAGSSSGTGGNAGMGGVPDPVGGEGGGEGGSEGAVDECPDDPDKVEPGACGCGVAESCAALKDALLHRYNFETAGTLASDSVGDADATIVGASAAGGEVAFDGTTDAFVNLPNGMISSLTDASFELWLTWAGGATWQRIFDFGDNDQGEDEQGVGETYLYLTPREGGGVNALRASFTIDGIGAETTVRGSAPLPTGAQQHVAVVVDDTNDQLRLYLNGELLALTGFTGSLAGLNDINNWVGRSNYLDTPLRGSIEEFRIYGAALTDAQVSASAGFGPNPAFL